MTEERSTHTEEQEKKPRPWRPTNRQVFWAIGMMVALATLALLIVKITNLYPDIWQALSRERVALLIGIGVALVAVIVLLAIGGALLGWTGFANKTLWEWLQLLGALAIPFVLAIAGFWFTTQQEKSGREVEEQRAQDAALQAYLDQMGTLLLEEHLRKSKKGSEVRTLAEARTLTVLGRLEDPSRKLAIMRFLFQAELVQRVERSAPLIGLSGANLNGLNLFNAPLSGAALSGADLDEADLRSADLNEAVLISTNLRGANLRGANLVEAMLSDANLSDANLRYADLSDTNLFEADLVEANLSDANLISANLRDAKGVTKEMLEQQAESLRGATMPDGTVFSERYVTREFDPAVSFEVGKEWILVPPVTTDQVLWVQWVQTGQKGSGTLPRHSQLLFTNPRHVFDPTNLSQPKQLPAPESAEEWVSWLQKHPNLETSKPLPVSVGGASGKLIDVRASSMPENYPRKVCGEQPCVPLYPLSPRYSPSDENGIASYEEWKDRFIIVDVGDETVIIDVKTYTDKFDEVLPKAQKVLDSVEWEGR